MSSELKRFTADLKHEARVKVLEAKVLNVIYKISNEEQKLDSLRRIADAAAWCIKNSKDERDDLDLHWRQQCEIYARKKNVIGFDLDHILCLIKGLKKSDMPLLEKITMEMAQLKSNDDVKTPEETFISNIHDTAFHHVVNINKAMETIKKNVSKINDLNARNKTPLDEAYAILIMRGEDSNCKFTQFMKSLGALEGNQMIKTKLF
jgi:hypothetical protein